MPNQTHQTCRSYGEGKVYFHKRRGAYATVSKAHVTLACEGCEYVVSLSTRAYSMVEIDLIRRQHVERVHHRSLESGAMALQE